MKFRTKLTLVFVVLATLGLAAAAVLYVNTEIAARNHERRIGRGMDGPCCMASP